MSVAMIAVDRAATPAQNVLASLDRLENFIVDYAVRRRPQAVSISADVAATFLPLNDEFNWAPDVRDELLARRRGTFGRYWLKSAVEWAQQLGVIDQIRYANDQVSHLENVAAEFLGDFAEEIVEDWMEEGELTLADWFDRDASVELADNNLRSQWVAECKMLMLEDAQHLARERFHAALIEIDSQRRGLEWHDDEGWHNLGELGRAVLAFYQERTWIADRWKRITRASQRKGFFRVMDLSESPPRRSCEMWGKLLSLHLQNVRAASDQYRKNQNMRTAAGDVIDAYALQRVVEIERWDSDLLNGRQESGMYIANPDELPCPFLDCLVVDTYVNSVDVMRADFTRPLEVLGTFHVLLLGYGRDADLQSVAKPLAAKKPTDANPIVKAYLVGHPAAPIRTIASETGLTKYQVEQTAAWRAVSAARKAQKREERSARNPLPLIEETATAATPEPTLEDLIAEQNADYAADQRSSRRRPR